MCAFISLSRDVRLDCRALEADRRRHTNVRQFAAFDQRVDRGRGETQQLSDLANVQEPLESAALVGQDTQGRGLDHSWTTRRRTRLVFVGANHSQWNRLW